TAYAIEDQPDGSLLLTVHDLSDPAGLQQDLIDRHVPAVVLVVDPAVPCTDRVQSIAPGLAVEGRPDHPNILLIRPALVPRGATVLLGLSNIPAAGGAGDGDTGSSVRSGGSGTTGPTGASGSPGGPSTTTAGNPGPVVVYFTVIQGPAPRCFP